MDKFDNEKLLGERVMGASPLGNNSIEAEAPGHAPSPEVSVNGGVDSYTTLMLHFDGVDNGTTITDEIGKTVTRTGVVTKTGIVSGMGTAVGYFNGTSANLTLADSTDWDFSVSDFTIETRVRTTSEIVDQPIFDSYADANNYLHFGINSLGNLYFYYKESGTNKSVIVSTSVVTKNMWNHVAVVKSGNTITVYLNGASIGSYTLVTAIPSFTGGTVYIGGLGGNYFVGYMDELRVSNVARWTKTFNPPEAPYYGTVIIEAEGDAVDTTPREVPLVYDSISGTWVAKLSRVNQEDREVGIDVAKRSMEDQRFLSSIGFQ